VADAEFTQAIRLVERLLAEDPLRKTHYRWLMRLHLTNGDRAGALHTYYQGTRIVQRELGVPPSPPTIAATKISWHNPVELRSERPKSILRFDHRDVLCNSFTRYCVIRLIQRFLTKPSIQELCVWFEPFYTSRSIQTSHRRQTSWRMFHWVTVCSLFPSFHSMR
jgi:hypothetical protein